MQEQTSALSQSSPAASSYQTDLRYRSDDRENLRIT